MQSISNIYFAPENQKLLFVPVYQKTLVSSISEGHLPDSALERATFLYSNAARALEKMAPEKGRIVKETPAIMVFQDYYQTDKPLELGKVPMSKYVAFLFDRNASAENHAFSLELASHLVLDSGLDFIGFMREWEAIHSRTIIRPVQDYCPFISEKISTFNDVARFYKNMSENVEKVDNQLIPTGVVNVVNHITYFMPKDTQFIERWKYVLETHPEVIPDKAELKVQIDKQFELNASNFRDVANVLNYLRMTFGLTLEESGVSNGVNFFASAYETLSRFKATSSNNFILPYGSTIPTGQSAF